ncbi:MAG: MFS transporter [Holosporaceae bacterium]|jgi:sugar phosphate permease|nr:MFS transporter [Holosporaceae bacterium]
MEKKSSKYMHIVLWIFSTIFFVYQYGIRSAVPNVFNEDLQHYFSIGATEMGQLISMFYIAYTAMQIPVGMAVDRFNRKLLSAIAFLCVALGTIMFVGTNNYIVASAAQLVLGVGSSFSFLLVMKNSNDFFPKEKVAMISSIGISCGSLGPVLMSPLFAHLSGMYYWRDVVLAFGIIGIVLSITGYLIINEKEIGPCSISNEAEKEQVEEYYGISDSLKIICSNSQFLWIGLFSMFILGPISSFCDAWGVSFVKSIYDISKVEIASVVGLVYFGTIFGAPLAAFLSEKLESYKKVMIGGSLILIVLFAIVIFAKLSIIILNVLLFLIGIVMTCQFLSFPAALGLAPKKIGATLVGVVNTVTMLGSTLLIPIIGRIIDFSKNNFGNPQVYSSQDYKNGMMIVLVSIALAIVALCFVKDEYRKNSSND